MGYFTRLLSNRNLDHHIDQPIWKYGLSVEEFHGLKRELQFSTPYNIDTRDVFVYYAEWWRNYYNGGSPSKKAIFDTLAGNLSMQINEEEFFKYAKKGANRLGVKWISKQNTLYFKTMLLQGGLPLKHISDNYGKYLDFLLAVLDEQPESVEDFSFKSEIISILPKSSQNDIIYENCFEIVRSILFGESIYDDLLQSNQVIERISNKLKERKKSLIRKTRETKPKVYWLLSKGLNRENIVLQVGLADIYTEDDLAKILGFELGKREYHFYLNDELLCVFRRTLNGKYKTDWFSGGSIEWEGTDSIPNTYVQSEGEKYPVHDFIQQVPNMRTPSLWVKYSEEEWRLVKSNGTSYTEAAVIFPEDWSAEVFSSKIRIFDHEVNWLEFEGEITLSNKEYSKTYYCDVKSFDWTIITQKPAWMLRANMPVVMKKPTILIYDEAGKKIPRGGFKISIRKRKSFEEWQNINLQNRIGTGCYDLKIERDGIVAYDLFYSIGDFTINTLSESLDEAKITTQSGQFLFTIQTSPLFELETEGRNTFYLRRNQEVNKVPKSIKASIKESTNRGLFFEFESPLRGVAIIGPEGEIIPTTQTLHIQNLTGLRILSNSKTETRLIIKSALKNDVKITKTLKTSFEPLNSIHQDLLHQFYLTDPMIHENKVLLELSVGSNSLTYEVAGFSSFLDPLSNSRVNITGSSENETELVAIPLGTLAEQIDLIPLNREEVGYSIPQFEFTEQFIVISSGNNVGEVMPRYFNTGEDFDGLRKWERIEVYHNELLESTFEHESWKVLNKYFDICLNKKIPFTAFDQIMSFGRSSSVAAKAFLFLGYKSKDKEEFIQKVVPRLELELGICFHWIIREDWEVAINSVIDFHKNEAWFKQLSELNRIDEEKLADDILWFITNYFSNSDFPEVMNYVFTGRSAVPQTISHSRIRDLRARLGERVLRELPNNIPRTNQSYGIPVKDHESVSLLIYAPIAAAESISGEQKDYPIWGGDDFRKVIRRNIQYAQYLAPEFYKEVLLHTLQKL